MTAWGQARHRCARRSQTPCLRPTGDGQPYLKRQSTEYRVQMTEYGVQSATSSAESSVAEASSA